MDIGGIFGYPLGWVMWAFYQLIQNYGVAILLFTLFVRVLLYPLGIKQQKASARMAMIQPKLAALQKKYKNNKEKLNEEQMKIYEEEGYNPMSGCLPLLIQLPILFGLINVIYNPLTHILRLPQEAIAAATEIAKNLTGFNFVANTPQISIINAVRLDPGAFASVGEEFVKATQSFDLNFLGFDMGAIAPFAWDWLIIIPLLSGVTSVLAMIVSMKFNYTAQFSEGQPMQGKAMMYVMPLVSLIFAFQLPVGVVVYWIASNILSGIQSYLLFKIYTPEKMEKLLEKEKKKKQGKGSRFQEAMKQAQSKGKQGRPDLIEDENGMVTYKGQVITKKEANRLRLAEARRRDAERYGEEYKEVTDDDLR